jgi:serine/threonine protein kinase/Tol biopolymer transport system component
MTDLANQILGNYRIEALIGTGGMGQVFRGSHYLLNRPAAIKVMHAQFATDPGFRTRFLQEARSSAALSHPNIVQVYDFGEQDGRFYLVMELMTDGSLKSLLQRHRDVGTRWDVPDALELVLKVADGLGYAHSRGMIHRDIKPDNLLLQRAGETSAGDARYIVKICDFGLARLVEGTTVTATGVMMGTPAYMSPEQCQGLPLDFRSDQYSLGIVLFEIVTGHVPFATKTATDALYKHVHTEPPSPRQFRPGIPTELEAIILRCLAKHPEERFASTSDLVDALSHVLTTITTTRLRWDDVPPRDPDEQAMRSLVGMQLNRYRIEGALAAGRMAWIFNGRHVGLERPIVLKVLRPQFAADEAFVGRFLHEARLAARLDHPNIVMIYDVGAAAGYYFIAMDLVEGQTLADVLGSGRPPVAQTLSVVTQLASALDHAHAQGVIHRDVKPGNVMIGPGGHVTLVDFGIARAFEDLARTPQGRLAAADAFGSPTYLAPEQLTDAPVTARTDVYALGCITYEMLTGGPPFSGSSYEALVDSHRHDVPVPVHELAPDVPREVDAVVARALAKDPQQRYDTAGEFAAALSQVLGRPLAMPTAARADFVAGAAPVALASGQPAGGGAAVVTAPAPAGADERWSGLVPGLLAVAAVVALIAFLWIRNGDGDGGDDTSAASGGDGASATQTALAVLAAAQESPTATATLQVTPSATPSPEPPTATPTITPSPTPSPSPTPDIFAEVRTGLVAFVSGRREDNPNIPDIYVMNTDGSNQRRLLTFEGADAYPSSDPAWSPDGTKILFKTSKDGDDEIYIANVDGTQIDNLTQDPGADEHAVWSPDGQRIAFQSRRDGNWEVYVMGADGSTPTNLTNSRYADWGPDWSRDGAKIVYVNDSSGNNDIYVMNADGTDAVNLTNDPAQDYNPRWSPDGTRIAFSRQVAENLWAILVMNADGSNVQTLTDGTAQDSTPTWSRDGGQILFRSNRNGNADVWIMNADGTDQKPLTDNPTYDGYPVQSPAVP